MGAARPPAVVDGCQPFPSQRYRAHREERLRVVALDAIRDLEGARAFRAKHGLTFSMVENGPGDAEVAKRVFGILRHPTTHGIGAEGRLLSVYRTFDADSRQRLAEEIVRWLAR